jgi:hypothetical protein
MDGIDLLRQRAQLKRDAAIAEARRIYHSDIQAIEALERRLPAPPVIDRSQPLAKPPSIVDFIKAVIPTDRPFTVSDVMVALGDAHAGQRFHLTTVRTHTSRLCSRGYLRRLYKTGHQETMYALAELPETEGGIETSNMATITHEILTEAGKPLKVVEIAVRMRERGYRADNEAVTLVNAVRSMFRNYPGRFERDKAGRWSVESSNSGASKLFNVPIR